MQITTALEATNKCPVTGMALSAEDVVVVNPSKVVTPRPPSGNSIPALLETMATEWDSLMLETFELRKQLQTTREELVRTLYERDAACRVIARLVKERDEAKTELAKASAGKDVVMKDAGDGPAGNELEKKLKATANQLSTVRRQNRKVVPAGLRTKEELKGIKFRESVKAHQTSKPGILCCAVDPQKSNLIVTGEYERLSVIEQAESLRRWSRWAGNHHRESGVRAEGSRHVIEAQQERYRHMCGLGDQYHCIRFHG